MVFLGQIQRLIVLIIYILLVSRDFLFCFDHAGLTIPCRRMIREKSGRRVGDGDVGPVGHSEELHVVFRDADLAIIETVRPLPEGHAPAEGVNDHGDGAAPGAEDLCSPENRTAFSCSVLHDFLNFSVIYPPFGCCSFPGTAKIFYNHICSFDPIQFIRFFY